MDIVQKTANNKPQEFTLENHFAFLGNGISLNPKYAKKNDKTSVTLYDVAESSYSSRLANRVIKSRYSRRSLFLNEKINNLGFNINTEFSISLVDKAEPVFILEDTSLKTQDVGFYSSGLDICIVGIVDPNWENSKSVQFNNLFFLHKGDSDKTMYKLNMGNDVIVSLKTIESAPSLNIPLLLALTSTGVLKVVQFNCDGKEPVLSVKSTLASGVAHFDYIVVKVQGN